jgi:hypothetical protein
MTTNAPPVAQTQLAERDAALSQRGFERHEDGWRYDGFLFRSERSWLQLETAWADNADPLSAQLGKPGPWKPIRAGQHLRLLFAIQESIVRDCDRAATFGETEHSAFECAIDWALATAAGAPPNGWASPDRTLLDACLPKKQLTIVHGSYMRQVELIHAPDRLALRLQLVSSLSTELPGYRLRCLRSLLLEAQDRHHLVRLGLARDRTQTAVVAEIDLTGVPSALLEPTISTSLDALRWVASLLVESADFIAEAAMASRALEICAASETNP